MKNRKSETAMVATTSEEVKSQQPISNGGSINNNNSKLFTLTSTDYSSNSSSKSDFEETESLEGEDYKCGVGRYVNNMHSNNKFSLVFCLRGFTFLFPHP